MKNLAEIKPEQIVDEYNDSVTPNTGSPMPNWMRKLEEAKKDLDKLKRLEELIEEERRQAKKTKPKEKAPILTDLQKIEDLACYMFQLAEEKAEEVKQLKLELAEKNKQIKKLQKQLKK